MDDDQREAVQRAVSTPDVVLLDGSPGTGKSRVIAEVIRRYLHRRHRVLFVAPTVAGIEVVLDRLVNLPELLALQISSRRGASADSRRVSAEGGMPMRLGDWMSLALTGRADQLEELLRHRRRESEVVERLLESWDRREALMAEREELTAMAISGDKSSSALTVSMSETESGPNAADGKAARSTESQAVDRTGADTPPRTVSSSSIPSVETAKRRWLGKWWPFVPKSERVVSPVAPAGSIALAKMGNHVAESLSAASPSVTTGDGNGEPARPSAARQPAEEIAARIHGCETEIAALTSLMEGMVAEISDQFRPDLAGGRESIVAQQTAIRGSLETLLEQWSAIRRWLDAELKPTLSEVAQFVSCCSLVAVPIGSLRDLQRTLKRGEKSRFDLVIVDEAESFSDRDLRRAVRHGERCLLVGDSTCVTGKSERKGDCSAASPAQGNGPRLWPQLIERFQNFNWRRDGDRLRGRVRWVAPEQSIGLIVEPLADRPEIELYFAEDGGERRELLEIVFPAGTNPPEAARFVYRELGELPIASSVARWFSEGPAERVQFHMGPISEWHSLAEGIDAGWQLTKLGRSRIAALRFHRSQGWDLAAAQRWCEETLRVSDPGRYVRLMVPHRDRSQVTSLAEALGFSEWSRESRVDEMRKGPCVEFIPVPALPQTAQLNRRGDHGCPLPRWRLPDIRRSAGLELQLEDTTARSRLTADQRAKLPRQGYVNPSEAECIVRLVSTWLDDWPRTPSRQPADVAIVTLEPAQAILIRDMVEKAGVHRAAAGAIRITWVDEFHQREADVVIVSLVSSPQRQWPNFGRKPTSMRSAVTRARDRLILVGDGGALTRRAFGQPPSDLEDTEAVRQQTAWVTALVQLLRAGDRSEILVRPGPPQLLGD